MVQLSSNIMFAHIKNACKIFTKHARKVCANANLEIKLQQLTAMLFFTRRGTRLECMRDASGTLERHILDGCECYLGAELYCK